MSFEKFLDNGIVPAEETMATHFVAIGEDECPAGSKCEGYKLGGTYSLGSADSTMVTSAKGDPSLVIEFELDIANVANNNAYELAFGFENGSMTEQGSFYRDPKGKINFSSVYEKGNLTEARSNGKKGTVDKNTWTGVGVFDEAAKKFKATATRKFMHYDKARELKTGASHKWGTVFRVKDSKGKIVAQGQSKAMSMVLLAQTKEQIESGATALGQTALAALLGSYLLLA